MFEDDSMPSDLPAPDYADAVYTSSLDEQAAIVSLLRSRPRGLKWPDLTALLLEHGSASAARASLTPDAELFLTAEQQAAFDEAHADLAAWGEAGPEFWTILDDRYPARLRDIQQAPPFLFARGERVADDVAVSVVGSREASPQGLRMAAAVARELVGMNISVVAGLAVGIDTAAHVTALEAGGHTVAVIATGINQQYPVANRDLHEAIADRGLLLSQFWPDAPPQKHNFLMRNATMSGYGIATIVVEAGEHSGARAQARMAVEHGRPVVLTDLVVNRTEWAKALIGRPGVHVASSISDVVGIVCQLVDEPSRLREAMHKLLVV